MDLTTTTTTIIIPTTTPTKSPESENDTPPHIQPINSLSFSNGVLKKHHYHHQRPPPAVVTYRECLKNHAASMGGHALDGCGEFMSSSTANSTDPTSLKCAACGCHRNFHRRESDEYYTSPTFTTTTATTHFLDFQRHPAAPHPRPRRFSSSPSPPPSQPSYTVPNMLLSLSTAVPDEQQQPMNHHNHHHHVATPATPTGLKGENPSGKKRSRTKFTQEQKEKMHSFAEKLGWKMQKVDETKVEQFCDEIGVGRGVLKVWMHNNKHTFAKKDINNSNGNIENGKVISFEKNGDVHLQVSSINGSSSSS